MNTFTAIFVVGLLLLIWLLHRSMYYAKKYNTLQQEFHVLNRNYEVLQKVLAKRGRRLDVLLSSISEVVLRVDSNGRVLGGNVLAEQLFEFERLPELPQSMLIFYRDSDWIKAYQEAVQNLPHHQELPEMKIKGRVLIPKLAALSEQEALLLCMDVTAYTNLQQKQKHMLDNLMHDLKTPLTSLLGYARSMEAFADDQSLRAEAVGVIVQEAKHINELLNHMLTLNQVEYVAESHEGFCDIVSTTQHVYETLDYHMQQKQLSFYLEHGKNRLDVAMAEVDCHRVLMNVLSNALRFSPEGSCIQCSITEAKNVARIQIKDEGPGIADKHLKRVTDRFYRVDHVRGRTEHEGHGLGLAIVKEILDRDGGKLALKNHPEGGLLVTIEMPLKLY